MGMKMSVRARFKIFVRDAVYGNLPNRDADRGKESAMTSLVRKAILLAAPAVVGCAQIPAPPNYSDAVADARTQMVKGGSLDTVRPASHQEQAPGQKGESTLPTPRPVNSSQATTPTPVASLNGPPTLANLEELADRVNPIIARDQAQIEAASGTALQAGIWSNPQFNSNNPEIINGRQSLLNAGFQLELPVNGKKKLDQAAANEATRQAEITLAQDRLALHAAIRQQFYTVLVDQRRVEVLTYTLDLVRKSYETGERRRDAGDLAQVDILNFLVDLQRADASLRSAQAILEGDKKQLDAIIGVPGLIREPLQGSLSWPFPEFDEVELIDYVTKHHTQIANALSVIHQNRIQLRRAEVEPYPNPTLGPAYQFGLIPGNDQFWFNITFNIPVWDLNQGNIRAAKANVAVATANIDSIRLNLVNQAANLLSQYLAALSRVERFEGRGKDGFPWYKFTSHAFALLQKEKVPNEVLLKLNSLKDNRLSHTDFVAELNKLLTPDEVKQYQNLIMKHAIELGIVANANESARLYQIMFDNKTTDRATLILAQRAAMQANSDYVDALQDLWNNATQLSGLMQREKFP
jgi:cobalt-zinc-cadmium efflux system outer membrane protein